MDPAEDAKSAFMAAVAAADPTRLVKAAVRDGLLDDWFGDRFKPRPIHVIAVGKAAPRMVWGLVEANVPFTGIGAAPSGIPFPQLEGFTWHKGEHPVPDAGSFAAGKAAKAWARSLPEGSRVLALVSGGGSACMESTDDDEALLADWRQWLREAIPIAEMNARRSARSHLKAGRLGRMLLERADVRAWVLSDTPDGPRSVASAPFYQADDPDRIPHRVLADSEAAVAAAGHSLTEGRTTFRFPRRLDGPLHDEVAHFLSMAAELGPGSALVGGGEPMVAVESDAPPGGRCQHAALQAAIWLRDHHLDHTFLAAGTDGIDGTTREAGACVTAADAGPGADEALLARDAHRFVTKRTIRTGPTGTNVNDLWIALGP